MITASVVQPQIDSVTGIHLNMINKNLSNIFFFSFKIHKKIVYEMFNYDQSSTGIYSVVSDYSL